jgi:hypothetical protein
VGERELVEQGGAVGAEDVVGEEQGDDLVQPVSAALTVWG